MGKDETWLKIWYFSVINWTQQPTTHDNDELGFEWMYFCHKPFDMNQNESNTIPWGILTKYTLSKVDCTLNTFIRNYDKRISKMSRQKAYIISRLVYFADGVVVR